MTDLRRQQNRLSKRRFDDAASSIDEELDKAFAEVNWERRNEASKSLVSFIQTYFVGLMIDDQPSPLFIEALQEMEQALGQSRPYNIELPRGTGKTSAVEMAVVYLLATGKRKFCVIVSQNARAAGSILKDICRPIIEKGTEFAQDFPEVCLPFQICDGAYRRRQLYRGVPTEIQKNSTVVQLARLVKDDHNETPTSGSVVTVRGITSGVRGLKVGKLRPDTVILDDLQTSETASNPEQVDKLMSIINKDIMNLSSKGKLAVLMTSTPLCPEDLCDRIENDNSWKTTKHPAVIQWPDDMRTKPLDGLWAQYFKMFDSELAEDLDHDGSLAFYKSNREAMDKGAVLFVPNRFKPEDGHISGLQAMLEKKHLIGEAAFSAEMQMRPKKFRFAVDVTPKCVLQKISSVNSLEVPDGYIFVAGAIDLNTSYAATALLIAFKPDTTSHVLWHETFDMNIDQKLPDIAYNAAVHEKLLSICQQLKSLNVKIDGLAIDAGGRNWDAVCNFCKVASRSISLPMCAFAGRSANVFNPFVRSRLREASNKTVLCGDALEHLKAGAGHKYTFFDADYYKETAQKALLSPLGAAGSCSLYSGDSEEHRDFAIQVCNEKLISVQHRAGKDIYTWKSFEPHDYCDCIAMCYAVAGSQGISGAVANRVRWPNRLKKRPRIKIV